MSGCLTALVSLCILSPLLPAAGGLVCSEKETLLRQMPNAGAQLTDCLMECTGMTYFRKIQLQDEHNIQFKDSTEGDLGEYCWATELKCTVGESFQRAYVVLPVDTSAIGHEMLEVKGQTSSAAVTLQAHWSHTVISDHCGLRYDVTPHFSAQDPEAASWFCVRVAAAGDVLGDEALKCPPYLVTLWRRNRNLSNQEGGG